MSLIRAVSYFRMSSTDQEGSIEQQQAWARDACPRAGIEVVESFIDSAKAGHDTASRTAFHRMLDYCRECFRQRQPIGAIVCWHSNRFSRADGIETSWFIHEFRKAGITRLFTAERWIDFRKMEDRILFGITQDASNHTFVKQLAQDSLRGRIATAEAGYWCGGPVPLGYRLVMADVVTINGKKKPRRVLVRDEATAGLVVRLFREYASGRTSLYQLSKQLDTEGIPPPRILKGHAPQPNARKAIFWDPTALTAILRNEVYLGGELIWNRMSTGKFFGIVDTRITAREDELSARKTNRPKDLIRALSRHEALIDRETFDRCQTMLIENRRRTTPQRGGGNLILTGILRCGHCGGPMVGRNPTKGMTAGPRYVCGNYLLHGKQTCNNNAIDEAQLFGCVVRKLRENLLNPETLAEMRETVRREASSACGADEGDKVRLEKELAEVKKQAEAAAKKYLLEENARASAICKRALDELADREESLERQLAAVQVRLQSAPSAESLIDDAVALMSEFEEVMAAASLIDKRAVLRGLIDHIDLHFAHRPVGKRTFSTFCRGVIYVKEGILPSTYFLSIPSSSPRTAGGGLPHRPGS